MAERTQYEKDLAIPCPWCHAETGVDCTNTAPPPAVCFGRRVKALAIERRPDLLDPPS